MKEERHWQLRNTSSDDSESKLVHKILDSASTTESTKYRTTYGMMLSRALETGKLLDAMEATNAWGVVKPSTGQIHCKQRRDNSIGN